MSGTIDKLKAKVDNVLHKDKTHDTTHTGAGVGNTTHTGTHGTHGTTGGLGNTHGSDPTGPHNSHLANQADPRVDSDRYGAAGNTAGAGGVGTGQYGSSNTHGTTGGLTGGSHNTHGTTGGLTGGSHTTHGTTGGLTGGSHNTHGTTGHSDPTGPHDSHLANKLDPRVDSDRYGAAGNTAGAGGVGTGQYGSNTHGTHGTTGGLTGGTHNTHNTHGTTGGLTGGTHNTHGNTGYSDPTGPHDSHLANKADPRVDSDRYGAAGNTTGAGGYGNDQYGATGSHGTTGEPLPKALTEDVSRADHRTGGLTGTHGQHGAANVGSGNSNKTAGPHNSDLLNKVDPRVDSDLDGSKTVGGNQTYR